MNLDDVRLEMKGNEEEVKAADDEPVRGLLPEHDGVSSSTTISE